MAKKLFFKIWTSLLSSMTLANADAIANVPSGTIQNEGSDTQIAIKESNATDLFLRHAKDTYSDEMLFAGHRSHRSHSSHRSHRSHSSHRSHYSSRSYDYTIPTPSVPITPPKRVTPPSKDKSSNRGKIVSPKKKYNIADVKMVQIALNTLGFNAGKVDGLEGKKVKTALVKYQKKCALKANGKIDSQTCLHLAREIKEKFPKDVNAKKMYNNLMRLYLKLAVE